MNSDHPVEVHGKALPKPGPRAQAGDQKPKAQRSLLDRSYQAHVYIRHLLFNVQQDQHAVTH